MTTDAKNAPVVSQGAPEETGNHQQGTEWLHFYFNTPAPETLHCELCEHVAGPDEISPAVPWDALGPLMAVCLDSRACLTRRAVLIGDDSALKALEAGA